ncbi:hypothetical protein [Nocardia brevicatena]|uniref:hypothetical protein n=1 Tax=Nocardia brevicatena TaxID=37327 RepID=UPI000593237C|nr:hypothetical protein [Nocardia brevicatena]
MGVELADELRRLEDERSTGVLHAGDGVFHLAEGVIASAACRRTPGLDRLVAEAGVVSAEDWQRAGSGDPAPILERPRVEALALLSVFDAAYFLLATPAVPEFRPAPPHWLAAVCHVRPRALMRECARRGDPESGPWPAELVDRAAVVPVRRVRRRRVVLTGSQAEILAAADTRRSVSGIARELGRTAYGCLEAVRDMTVAGLIEPPTDAPVPAVDTSVTEPEAVAEYGLLPQRRGRHAAPVPESDEWEPVDRDLLVRLRAALEDRE